VRDRVGIKPLYYCWNGQDLAFGSELKALEALPRFSSQINYQAITQFLHVGYIPAPHTIYEGVYKLPPGSWLRISADGLQTHTYWQPSAAVGYPVLSDEATAGATLKELLESSVKYQLISDVPLGVFLSGGIDSSLVSALAVAQSDTQINTFSIGFRESRFNESEYARAVARHLGTNHHEFFVSVEEAKGLVESMLDAYDEPYADSSAIPTMLVSRLAREHVKVVLGGDGGDELFFGYGMYQWAERLAKPWWRYARYPAQIAFAGRKQSRYQKALHMLDMPDAPDLQDHVFSQEQGFFSARELKYLLPAIPPAAGEGPGVLTRTLSPAERQALFDLQYYLPDDLLVKVDRASMRYGLEARVPLLDHRIVEFALNLSPDLKYRQGVRKYLLKKILYQYLPESLFNRPKQGFAIALGEWLRSDLRFLLNEYLSPEVLTRVGLVDVRQVESLKKRFFAGEDFWYNRLWVLLVLHRWMVKHY
jgi:asparagine synthase (glutamine-hydrolysing)